MGAYVPPESLQQQTIAYVKQKGARQMSTTTCGVKNMAIFLAADADRQLPDVDTVGVLNADSASLVGQNPSDCLWRVPHVNARGPKGWDREVGHGDQFLRQRIETGAEQQFHYGRISRKGREVIALLLNECKKKSHAEFPVIRKHMPAG
jgi:hypothetical protein